MRPASRLLPILFLVLLLIPACGGEDEAPPAARTQTPADLTPAFGDAIVWAKIADAANLLPVLSSDSASNDVIELVYNALVKIDKDLNIVGDLAESFDVSDDSRTITFHLRRNVRWHDGRPFTARDCLFTYQVMVDPQTPTAYAEQFLQIEKAEAPDDYTFRVTYRRPYARALITWGLPLVPAHLLEGKNVVESDLARAPVGTGPYRFVKWETGQEIALEANPDYFEGRPYLSRVVVRVIPDMATMFLELKAGNVDWMTLTPDQYVRQTDTAFFRDNYRKYKYLDFGYTYLGFNLLNPKFQDKRVRQAVAYALDKDEIVQGVLLGLGRPANGPYKPGHWAYNPAVTPYPFDPGKARSLLAEAGWEDQDGDGIREKDGRPFEFTLLTNQGNQQRESTALIIQQRLKDVGIAVKIRIVEWAAFLKEFVDKKRFEAVVLGWNIPLDPDLYNVWHSSQTAEGQLNFISFKNEEVDRLIDQGRFTLKIEERQKAYFRIQEILKEEAPYVFLYVPEALPLVAARFQGIEPAPAGIVHNFIRWYVPLARQKYKLTP
ncbi:MAG: peptide-binding protein [Thermodesulfobacteriota bacterium]